MRFDRAFVALALAAGIGVATAQDVDPALTAAIAARDKAFTSRNADETAKYTADDYLGIGPGGTLVNKKQRIDGLRTPARPGATPIPRQRIEAVRIYGRTAAVARMKGADLRQLFVWVKKSEGWQVVAIHNVPDAVPPLTTTQPGRPKIAEASTVQAPSGLSGDRAAVFTAFKQIQDAYFSGNRAAYERLTAPEHVRLNAGGTIRFGTEGNSGIDGPRTQPKFSNITVQVFDQVGIVRWLETRADGSLQWLTRVFAKNGGGWQQVATASSIAHDPPIAP